MERIRSKLSKNDLVQVKYVYDKMVKRKSKASPKISFIEGKMASGTKSNSTIQSRSMQMELT